MAAHSEEIEDLFQRNSEQAESIGLEGTPGFIIGNVQSFGGMTLKQLETSVANARKANREAAAKAGKAAGK
jgi:protein-disulfide isomerase